MNSPSGELSLTGVFLMNLFAQPSRTKRWTVRILLMLVLVPCFVARAETRHVEKRVQPVYPELARRMHITGVVRVTAAVSADGSVTDAKATSGNQMLTSAAEEAVRKWKFAQSDAASSEVVEVSFVAVN
jgi:TonB family protein